MLVNRFHQILKDYPVLVPFVRKVQTFTLPGFERVPVYDVFQFLVAEIKKDTLAERAKAIAFSFFLAIFPAVIFLFSLIPYVPIEGFQENLMLVLQEVLPDQSLFNLIDNTATDILHAQRGGLLSIGFVLTFVFATQGVVGIMNSFNKRHSIYKQRNFLMHNLVAIKLMVLLMLLLMVSIALIMTGEVIIDELIVHFDLTSNWANFGFNALRYLILITLFFFSISFIYYYGPAVKKKWKFISLGSTVATILSIATSLGFSYYLQHFANYNMFYGSIATIIIMLIWIFINAFVLLIGFELNASIYYNKSLRIERQKQDQAIM